MYTVIILGIRMMRGALFGVCLLLVQLGCTVSFGSAQGNGKYIVIIVNYFIS